MHEGFDYSAAMKAKGGSWTYPDLFTLLAGSAAHLFRAPR